MQNDEVNQQLVEDLKYYYIDKKRLINKNATFIETKKNLDYMEEAAKICDELNMSAAAYIQFMYDKMGDLKAYFSPQHLRGDNAKKALKDKKEKEENSYQVEVDNSTIPYDLLWEQQNELARRYMKIGYTAEDILMDASLKFFAWYRILSTTSANSEVIRKYKSVANKELTPRLIEFIKERDLELSRITGKYE
jgi:hypothetical protein